MEIVKSKLITRVTLFLAFTFLFGACAFAQDLGVVRYDSYDYNIKKKVKTRVASYGVELKYGKDDVFYLGVSCDSINSTVEAPLVYVYFPKTLNPKGVDMTISFSDGTKELFRFIRLDDNCVSYQVTASSYRKMKTLTFKHVEFTNLGSYTNFLEMDYFIKFFKLIG